MGFFGWVFYCQPCLQQVHHLEGDEEMLGEAGDVVAIAERTSQLLRLISIVMVFVYFLVKCIYLV